MCVWWCGGVVVVLDGAVWVGSPASGGSAQPMMGSADPSKPPIQQYQSHPDQRVPAPPPTHSLLFSCRNLPSSRACLLKPRIEQRRNLSSSSADAFHPAMPSPRRNLSSSNPKPEPLIGTAHPSSARLSLISGRVLPQQSESAPVDPSESNNARACGPE